MSGVDPFDPTPDDYNLPSGRELARLRLKLGISQREAARIAGLGTHRTIGRIEKEARDGNLETVRKLLEAYRQEWGSVDEGANGGEAA